MRAQLQVIDGSVVENTLGAVGISNGEASGHRISRRKAAPARNGEESFLVKFVMSGSIDATHRHRRRRYKPGEVLILNGAEHFSCDVAHPTQVTMLKVPCHVLRARLPWIDDACISDWPSRSSISRDVAQFVRGINLGRHRRGTLAALEGSCVDLLTTMLDSGRRDVAGGEGSEEIGFLIIERLRTFLRLNLGKLGLSAADAAVAFRISERQVQKMFQREGSTFGRELMDARLDHANSLLASAGNQGLSINEISFRCGFASQAHFSSRFRDRFGMSPRERRRPLDN